MEARSRGTGMCANLERNHILAILPSTIYQKTTKYFSTSQGSSRELNDVSLAVLARS